MSVEKCATSSHKIMQTLSVTAPGRRPAGAGAARRERSAQSIAFHQCSRCHMTTAHKPTFHPAIGSANTGGFRHYAGLRQVSVKDLAAHTHLKYRYVGILLVGASRR